MVWIDEDVREENWNISLWNIEPHCCPRRVNFTLQRKYDSRDGSRVLAIAINVTRKIVGYVQFKILKNDGFVSCSRVFKIYQPSNLLFQYCNFNKLEQIIIDKILVLSFCVHYDISCDVNVRKRWDELSDYFFLQYHRVILVALIYLILII